MRLETQSGQGQVFNVGGIRKNGKNDQTSSNTGNKQNIKANHINLQQDNIEMKRKSAQKKAMKIVGDVYSQDQAVQKDILERKDKIASLRESMNQAGEEIADYKKQIEDLKTSMGIEDDSQEQKDLDLLIKGKDDFWGLSKEEREEYKNLKKKEPTEYQSMVMERLNAIGELETNMRDDKLRLIGENVTIREVRKELLKSHDMLDANEAADKIEKAASDEIIGMIKSDAMDKIQEKLDEEMEKAEEKAEEKEKEEEKAEEAALKKELEELKTEKRTEESKGDIVEQEKVILSGETQNLNQSADLDLLTNAAAKEGKVQKEIQDIVDKMKLIMEDIKGAAVDTSL